MARSLADQRRAVRRQARAMLLAWMTRPGAGYVQRDYSVPLALTIYLHRAIKGKTRMPKPVRQVLNKWRRAA